MIEILSFFPLRADCPVQIVADNPLINIRGIYQTEVLKILVWPMHNRVRVKMCPDNDLHYTCSVIPEGSWGALN